MQVPDPSPMTDAAPLADAGGLAAKPSSLPLGHQRQLLFRQQQALEQQVGQPPSPQAHHSGGRRARTDVVAASRLPVDAVVLGGGTCLS